LRDQPRGHGPANEADEVEPDTDDKPERQCCTNCGNHGGCAVAVCCPAAWASLPIRRAGVMITTVASGHKLAQLPAAQATNAT
jgi:hypothetical protein